MSVINSFTQHTINLTRKALRLGSDFVHPVHDDTPDEPDYLSNADVPVETRSILMWGYFFIKASVLFLRMS